MCSLGYAFYFNLVVMNLLLSCFNLFPRALEIKKKTENRTQTKACPSSVEGMLSSHLPKFES